MRAIAPKEIPALPENASEWRRSLRRGSMFHAHSFGVPVCGAKIYLDRNTSEPVNNVGDMQFWGVCPRCVAKGRQPAPANQA